MGLPGSGKTTLVKELAPLLNAVVFNADEVRKNIHRDLGFSLPDRIEHARRMSWLCDRVTVNGGIAIADFICPTRETREAFGRAFVVWVDRIKEGRFADTNRMFQPPQHFDVRVKSGGTPRYWAEVVFKCLQPIFDPQKPTALIVGRFQPFHEGHSQLVAEAIARVGQCCIAIRDTSKLDENNPLSFHELKQRIDATLKKQKGRYHVVQLPNISHIFYGRDVGYTVERIFLGKETEALSASKIRIEIQQSLSD